MEILGVLAFVLAAYGALTIVAVWIAYQVFGTPVPAYLVSSLMLGFLPIIVLISFRRLAARLYPVLCRCVDRNWPKTLANSAWIVFRHPVETYRQSIVQDPKAD